MPSPSERSTAQDDLVAELTGVLVKTLRALGQAGHPDRALPLAASAWSVLRHREPEQAERINGTMHYLARRPESAPVTGTSSGTGAGPHTGPTSPPGSTTSSG